MNAPAVSWGLFVFRGDSGDQVVGFGILVLILLPYTLLQGYALFNLRGRLRRIAGFILILVVSFTCLMIGSVLNPDNQYAPGYGIVQAIEALMAWIFAILILSLLLVMQATFPKTSLPINGDAPTSEKN